MVWLWRCQVHLGGLGLERCCSQLCLLAVQDSQGRCASSQGARSKFTTPSAGCPSRYRPAHAAIGMLTHSVSYCVRTLHRCYTCMLLAHRSATLEVSVMITECSVNFSVSILYYIEDNIQMDTYNDQTSGVLSALWPCQASDSCEYVYTTCGYAFIADKADGICTFNCLCRS